MKRPLVWTFGVLAALAGCVHSPLGWSPDGRWLAYTTVAGHEGAGRLAPGWIFGDDAAGSKAAPAEKGAASAYRIWATRAETGETVLLEDSPGPLTSPGWNPDGTALAFGRLVFEDGGRGRFEVVVQEAPDRRRVIHEEDFEGVRASAAGLPGLGVAWSPDGRYLAVPRVAPKGLAILNAEDGRLVKAIDEAFLPSWSPKGGKLAFFRGGSPEGLCVIDAKFGEPRLLEEIPHPVAAPSWSRDGQALWVVRAQPSGKVEILKVGPEGEGAQVVKLLGPEAPGGGNLLGASMSIDGEGQNLFTSVQVEGQPSEVIWHTLNNQAILKRFNPVDRLVPLGGLSASPAGKWLALRAGAAGIAAPPALCDAESTKLTPLAPDDATRVEWVTLLVEAARTLIRTQYPAPTVGELAADRPTTLPIAGEVPLGPDTEHRLRHLAGLGRPLCDRPAGGPEADPAVRALLDEARLFFDALAGKPDAALADLDAFEPTVEGADRRFRLLGLRAQLLLAKGDIERANRSIAYLNSIPKGSRGRIEMTPSGPTLTEDSDRREGWPAFLAACAEAKAKAPAPTDEAAVPRRAALAAEAEAQMLIPAPRPQRPIRRNAIPMREMPRVRMPRLRPEEAPAPPVAPQP